METQYDADANQLINATEEVLSGEGITSPSPGPTSPLGLHDRSFENLLLHYCSSDESRKENWNNFGKSERGHDLTFLVE